MLYLPQVTIWRGGVEIHTRGARARVKNERLSNFILKFQGLNNIFMIKQKQNLKQKTSIGTVVIIASTSIVLIIVAMMFVFNVGNVRKMLAKGTTSTTVKDGNWNTPATWSGGIVPASGNTIVIANKVTNSGTIATGPITLNSGGALVNNGNITVGTSASPAALILNKNSSITNGAAYTASNGAVLTVYGTLTNNSGTIIDNGHFIISQSVTSTGGVTDNDSLVIGTSFTSNSGTIIVNKLAYLGIGGSFTGNGSSSLTIDSGYVAVGNNFTDTKGAVVSGTGGGMYVVNNILNSGSINGTLDVCDSTPNTKNDVNGTITHTVTNCSFAKPKAGPSGTYGGTPLPVTLVKFTATKQGDNVALVWTTASEINNDRFEVERSQDGNDFSVIATVKGNGTKQTFTDYSYIDDNPLSGIGYYRLHQFDYNGKSAYSPISAIHSGSAAQEPLDISAYPNPVKAGSDLHLEMTIPVAEMLNIQLVDMKGQSVYHNEAQAEAGKIQKDINLPGNLSGMYILNVTYRGQTTSKKILVR